jgi:hypothetical protein
MTRMSIVTSVLAAAPLAGWEPWPTLGSLARRRSRGPTSAAARTSGARAAS